ncbi:MAG: diaminopimelate epimerase [Omnitrophica bacterium]|nr:diaminopimelate epimerase [Candidatus Omnitrophota bacterium]
MKERIEFTKAVAAGNDFIIIDRFKIRNIKYKIRNTNLAKMLCQRKISIGADGLLLIEASKRCDFKMRIFNPDGSEVNMCGNGIRCAVLYAAKRKICSRKMTIETRAGELSAEVKQDKVRIKMSKPKDLRLKFDLDVNGKRENISFINTGVPHVVFFVQGLDSFNVPDIGRAIRYHAEFQPKGTNTNFVEVLDRDHICLRTYERGVEQETLACGTGAVASAIITASQMEHPQGKHKIRVDTQSGEALFVYFKIEKGAVSDIYLEGRAEIVYKGGLYV